MKLVRRLAREVWLVQHPVHGEVIFKRAGADEIELTMHAQVVPVLEFGADYMVLQRVDGEPLSMRLRRQGRLAVGDALALARRIARTLAQLHVRGIAHRDVKPENVVGDTLLDFGSAAMIGTSAPIAATIAYSPPEQRVAYTVVDARADIYAFGGTLFAMLVGRVFEGAPLREVLAGVSPALDALVMRCLACDPAHRFGSGGELYAALARIEDHDALGVGAGVRSDLRTACVAGAGRSAHGRRDGRVDRDRVAHREAHRTAVAGHLDERLRTGGPTNLALTYRRVLPIAACDDAGSRLPSK